MDARTNVMFLSQDWVRGQGNTIVIKFQGTNLHDFDEARKVQLHN